MPAPAAAGVAIGAAPIAFRLIGVLDDELVATFCSVESALARPAAAPVFVDVRDVVIRGEEDLAALLGAIDAAREAGRDVRLDVRGQPWQRTAGRTLAGQPPIEPSHRAAVRRLVVVARSAQRRRG